MFEKISEKVNFPEQEKKILSFWDKNEIFQKSLHQRKGKPEYVFYDGPPFATGLPHYGHLLAGTIKDVIPRYQTMKGRYVDRVFGWDCHGLPVENEMERELGIKSKHEIEEYGVHRFNEECRNIVLRYTSEWKNVVHRIGRWVDFKKGYRTMDKNFMESIWWVFKELWQKDLIYEGYKVLPYCPRCATPLSNFEANQGYQEVDDPSITVQFKINGEENTYLLVWTTTPWTLPSNMGLAVGEDIDYVKVLDNDKYYILAEDRLSVYYKETAQPEILQHIKGSALLNFTYEPLFPYFRLFNKDGAFRVVSGDFVSTSEGTGIVHIAPGFGEDDAALGRMKGIPSVCPVDSECCFDSNVTDFYGRFVKDCDKEIISRLKREGKLIHRGTIRHSYPHCWRCESPLIYRAISTWFVRVESIKDLMLKANEQIRWVPEHIKFGRFGKWIENAHDWAISRNRYWGCPIPIWKNNNTGETFCVGAISELEKLSGLKIEDIHKHFIDEIKIKSPQSGDTLERVSEVLDCWFESGSMPYAQRHYPFEHKAWLEDHFPADFIAEGLDQTRGWFYTLVVLGVALFDKPAFRNVIVNGLVLAEDGRKMSKRLKNYPDPDYIMDKYGADALRLCLLTSPVLKGEDLRFSENTVKEIIRSVMLPLWNSYSFFITYARVDHWKPEIPLKKLPENLSNVLDRWVLGRLQTFVSHVCERMDNYDIQGATSSFAGFLDGLTNWYIRRSRRRFWKSENDNDKNEAYHTLYHVLITFCQTAAPYIPFITEALYANLKSSSMPESVHLCDFPTLSKDFKDNELDRKMSSTIKAVSLGRSLRSQAAIRTRQPLKSAILVSMNSQVRKDLGEMKEIIAEELNVKNIIIKENEEELVNLTAKANFRTLGPRLGKTMKEAAGMISKFNHAQIQSLLEGQVVNLTLGGETQTQVEVTINDIEIRREERPDIAAVNEQDITVALDLTVNQELEMEGWAREIVNRLQNLRKESNLEVTDRIKITYSAPQPIENVIAKFKSDIARETLAEEFHKTNDMNKNSTLKIGDHTCYFSLAKINR